MDAVAPAEILAFWFGRPGDADYGQARSSWFRKDAIFDDEIRRRFLPTVDAALAGQLADWRTTPDGALALILTLDQFPRNLFRNHAKAFAGDPLARPLAAAMVDRGWDQARLAVERAFIYLPFEHSEALADQARSLALFAELARSQPGTDGYYDYAVRHHAVIARFGRFPHRNAALGRVSSAEEVEYLAQPGSGF